METSLKKHYNYKMGIFGGVFKELKDEMVSVFKESHEIKPEVPVLQNQRNIQVTAKQAAPANFCSQCGTSLEADARFCRSCGTAVKASLPVIPAQEQQQANNIRKCPKCGGDIPYMSASCKLCGNEISNQQVALSVAAFFERLDALDQQIFEQNAKKELQGPVGGAWGALFGIDTLVKLGTGIGAAEKRKLEMIKNFPIPNSKEDIFEFAILACSRMDVKVRMMGNPNYFFEKKEADKYKAAWTAKIKQAWLKAQIAFGSDREGLQNLRQIIKEAKVKL